MKKVLLSAALVLAGLASYAQYNAGSILVNGNLGFSTGSSKINGNDAGSGNNFGIGLKGGYFLKDNIAVGIGIDYQSSKATSPSGAGDDVSKSNQFGWLVFGRYYMPYNEKLAFFGELDIMGYSGTNTFTPAGGTDAETKMNGFSAGIVPSFSYLIDPRISLEMGYGFLGYSSNKTTTPGGTESESNGFGLNLDMSSLVFGLTMFF